MQDILWNEFWWNNITGPHMVVSKVADALMDARSVILAVPADLPWRHNMRGAIHNAFRDRMYSGDITIEPIDIVDDNPDNIEPGRFLLSRFASTTVSRGYRERSKLSLQQYISANNVLKNRIIWIKGLKDTTAKQWISFCQGFSSNSVNEGLFVLEVQGETDIEDIVPLELIRFDDYVSSYDVQLFNSFILDNQNTLGNVWSNYISTVCALMCGTDAEISKMLIDTTDFRSQSAIDGIREISEMPDYSRRGEDSGHVLCQLRNNNLEHLEHKQWEAQVRVLFPIIELERVSIIRKWEKEIQLVLDNKYIVQFNQPLEKAIDAELGTLCYLLRNKFRDDNGVLYFNPDKETKDRIEFLHDCRNPLAHASCIAPEHIKKLIDNS